MSDQRKWVGSPMIDGPFHVSSRQGEASRPKNVNEEHAALRAEIERLTRECLDREASETDARERLRRCEERLAAVEAAAQGAGLHGIVRLVRGERHD